MNTISIRSALAAMAGKLRSNKSSALRGAMCFGCGHEHNCGVSGCAVLLESAERLRHYEELGTPESIRRRLEKQSSVIYELNLRIDELREQLDKEKK
jgi:hypothetical protein